MLKPKKDIFSDIREYPASEALLELMPNFSVQLPDGVNFEDDTWNILDWKTRKGNSKVFNIDFGDFSNNELKFLAKVFLLHKRLEKNFGTQAAYNYVSTIKHLDKIIWRKSVKNIINADFYQAEMLIKNTSGSAHRLCKFLSGFGEWLNARIGLPVSYASSIPEVHKHGRKGTEEGRQSKLINTLVIRDMVEMNARTDLSDKDRFYLSVFVLFVATGFRINELATLPKNCLENRSGEYNIQYYAEKNRNLQVRFIPRAMLPAVQAALGHIIRITEPGREAVLNLKMNPGLDWSGILDDKLATEYFVRKFAHEWTSQPRNLMINPDGVWLEKEKRIVDIIAIMEETGSKSAAARQLGVTRATVDGLFVAQNNARMGLLPCTIASRGKDTRTDWDTDARVISLLKFMNYCGIRQNNNEKKDVFRPIIEEAQQLQLRGKIYPAPKKERDLEEKYVRTIRPVVEDYDGKALLEPENALFIIPRYSFSEARATKDEDYRLISDKAISRWFTGELRSVGTLNHEDNCFNRLGIIDPGTEKPAKFSSHDVRHWLDTTYAEGHMDEETIALIFSRKMGANHTYDQISKMKRLENIRQAIRDGKSVGHVSQNYNNLAKYSREDAEQYLLAGTRMVNIMPHGACTLSWGMEACPNHLSCFAGGGKGKGCCEHLQIDMADTEQIEEVQRIKREVSVTLEYMMEESPQYIHFRNIKWNIESLLGFK